MVELAGQDTTFDSCFFYKTAYEDHFGGDPDGTLTVRNSYFTMIDPPNDGAHRDLWNPYTGGGWSMLFENNIVEDIWLFAVLMQDSVAEGTLTIRNNVFTEGGHAMFRLGSGNGGIGNVTVSNNIFHNVLNLEVTSSKVTEKNNIFIRTDGWTDQFGSTTVHATAGTSQYNLYAPNTGPFQSGTGNAQIDLASSDFVNITNPLGVDGKPGTDDDGFMLRPTSVIKVKDLGTPGGFSTDIRGKARTGAWDVGPYEY